MDKYFLQGGGVISEKLRFLDWEKTSLGKLEEWSPSLKASLNICLNSPFPMLVCWGPEMIMLFNQPYSEFLEGNDTYEALGKPAKEIWETVWDTIGPLLENVISTGNPIKLEDQLFQLNRKGIIEDRYFTFSYSPIWEEDGVSGVLTIVHETTKNVINERLTKIEQERMQRIFSQAPAAICILNGPQMIFDLVNPVYQNLFPGRSLVGKPVLEALPEINRTHIHEILLKVFQSGQTFEGKELLIPLSKYDGAILEDRYFNFIFQARWNDAKEIDGIVVFAYEVTDFVRARQSAEELALKVDEQAKLFDITLTAIKDMVYTFNRDGRFTYSNKPLLELLGISLNEITGKNFHDLQYPEKLAYQLQSQIEKVIVTGNPTTGETEYTSPLGNMGHYEYIFTPVFDQEGQVVLVAGSTRDISERKKSEEAIKANNKELIKLNDELNRVNADLDNFIYTASHDLKTPISNIEGLINVLSENLFKDSLENPFVAQLLQLIRTSIERFNSTLQDLTEITKLQRLQEVEMADVDLEELIEEIKLDLLPTINQSNARIKMEFNEFKNLQFSKKNLRSILYNLISNSLKYESLDRETLIAVSGKVENEFFVISVQDNGLGIDLSKGGSIFGMFTRYHNHVNGSGIGLYIVKKIMDNAGGKIEVESNVGKGSTFRLFFKKINNKI